MTCPKFLRDYASCFYDDLDFRAFSGIRLMLQVFLWIVVITWAAVLFFGRPVSVLATVMGAPFAGLVGYIGKKRMDNQRARIEMEERDEAEYGDH